MKLAWLSPLPPLATRAAELTAGVLPLVSERFEVVLMTGQESWDPALEEHATVTRAALEEPPWRELNGADMTVFAIGADAASAAIRRRLAQRHPGLVVVAGEPPPLFGELARTALGVLVGSPAAAERLAGVPCPVVEAVFDAKADPGPWVDAFAGLVEAARRFQPLAAVHALARTVTDELGQWSGFPGAVEAGPLRAARRPHPLHHRVVSPVADAVDELLRQTRTGRKSED